MQRIEIKTGDFNVPGESSVYNTKIYVDGHELEWVRSFTLKQVAGQPPILSLDLCHFNLAVDQKSILWNQLLDTEMEITFKADTIVGEQCNFYFTFGNAECYPFKDEYVIVVAGDLNEAIKKFKEHYPHPVDSSVLNCADFLPEQAWKQKEGNRFDRFKGKEPVEIVY